MVQIKYPGRQQLWSNSTQENNPSAHPLWVLRKMQKQVYKSGDGTSWAYRKCERRFRNQEERETHQISLGMAASLITCQNLICNLQTVATGQEAENSDQESSGKCFCLSICFNQQSSAMICKNKRNFANPTMMIDFFFMYFHHVWLLENASAIPKFLCWSNSSAIHVLMELFCNLCVVGSSSAINVLMVLFCNPRVAASKQETQKKSGKIARNCLPMQWSWRWQEPKHIVEWCSNHNESFCLCTSLSFPQPPPPSILLRCLHLLHLPQNQYW